jgi:predicted Zn-dependent protease
MTMQARELQQRPGRNHFLKRAAVLHADAALLARSDRPRPPFDSSFLLPGRVFVQTGDGTQGGLYGGDVHWEFGRILLDGVTDAGQDQDVQDWYGATLAHMLAVDHLDNPHFDHALRLFPRSGEILFLNGCLHESLADPRVQTIIDEIKVPARTVLDVRSERAELNEAVRLFRRAVQASPGHGEARLRLGRTLARLGRHQEAASELRAALDLPEPVLQYYASLFLAAEEEAMGGFDRARALYERAVALVPSAQAPRLGLSQLAHRTGNRVAARAALESLLRARDRGSEDDPWWTYSISCGRDADQRMVDVYRVLSGGSQ